MLKQTIILATQINQSEKLKSRGLFNKKTINRQYLNALDLSKYLLQLSGVVIKDKFISDVEVGAYLYSNIKQINYFKKYSFNDVLNLIKSINDLRRYIVGDENKEIINGLSKGIFKEKNAAIIEVYNLMNKLFKDNNLIDEVGIIRFALENTKTFSEIDFVDYDDEYPLHKELLKKASGKEVVRVSNNFETKPLMIASYIKAFGQTNEVENILYYIKKNNIPFDQCLIAAAEVNDYSNIFSNYRDLLGIPLTIGVGITLLETRPGKLFSIINDWMYSLYNTHYLNIVIHDESFAVNKLAEVLQIPEDNFEEINKSLEYPESVSLDSIIATVGDMKMSFDKEANNQKLEEYKSLLAKYSQEGFNKENTDRRLIELQFVERFVNELNDGLSAFIAKYAVNNDSKDNNALGKILKYLRYHFECNIPYEDTKKAIYAQSVGRESIQEGTLYFTSINNAVSCLRPYLFIVGLSSNNFPGASKENPVLLDDDYELFGVNNASTRSIAFNKDSFFRLLNEANDCGVSIHLSYAYYNSQTLKEQNASSVVFEAYKLENGENKTVEDLNDEFKATGSTKYQVVEFFNNDVLPVSNIGKTVSDNKKIPYDDVAPSATNAPIDLTKVLRKPKGFSASSVTNYAHCPYLFFLTEILKMEQPEEVDIYEIIPANESGTLAHYLLETLDKTKVKTAKEFGDIAAKRFEEYLIIHRPTNDIAANLAKQKFVEMMENGYEMEGDTKTLFKEEDISYKHSSGLRIHGFPDKVIENKDGTLTVVDYKTGNKIKHSSDDIASMIQCTMYAYIVEKTKHRTVSSFEYWYLKHKHKVYSTDNDKTMTDHYANLDTTLNNLHQSLLTGEFTPTLSYCLDGNKQRCYFCKVCMKGRK